MRVVLGTAAAVLIGLALFEVTMQPSGAERAELAIIFLVMAGVSTLAAIFLPILARRSQKLIVTLFSLSLVSLVVASVGLAVAASRMFFSEHDLTLVLVVLGFGLVASVAFAVSASASMTEDVERMRTTARRVATGDLTARTEVIRADEIGELATEIDALAEQLAAARRIHEAEEERRRTFFASVSHDLRTPLASMQAATEALADGVATDPDRYLLSLQADLAAIRTLVDDLFLLARVEAGDVVVDLAVVDLTEVADEAIEVVRPIADAKGVSVELVADRRIVATTSDSAVGRILRNLLDNAVRHAPDGTTVRVLVERADPGTVITVCDEGGGFPEAFVEEAFEMFTRSDAARVRADGGAGLGLAIARALTAVVGGEIAIVPGDDGRVAVRLP
ncbi:MAG: HAMP domain-containing histidine kinase [Acidimicrobiia bacterium]|nr:HAMP domain-containing histidine kinase [Acidimicrobiia bacterium]